MLFLVLFYLFILFLFLYYFFILFLFLILIYLFLFIFISPLERDSKVVNLYLFEDIKVAKPPEVVEKMEKQ